MRDARPRGRFKAGRVRSLGPSGRRRGAASLEAVDQGKDRPRLGACLLSGHAGLLSGRTGLPGGGTRLLRGRTRLLAELAENSAHVAKRELVAPDDLGGETEHVAVGRVEITTLDPQVPDLDPQIPDLLEDPAGAHARIMASTA